MNSTKHYQKGVHYITSINCSSSNPYVCNLLQCTSSLIFVQFKQFLNSCMMESTDISITILSELFLLHKYLDTWLHLRSSIQAKIRYYESCLLPVGFTHGKKLSPGRITPNVFISAELKYLIFAVIYFHVQFNFVKWKRWLSLYLQSPFCLPEVASLANLMNRKYWGCAVINGLRGLPGHHFD